MVWFGPLDAAVGRSAGVGSCLHRCVVGDVSGERMKEGKATINVNWNITLVVFVLLFCHISRMCIKKLFKTL